MSPIMPWRLCSTVLALLLMTSVARANLTLLQWMRGSIVQQQHLLGRATATPETIRLRCTTAFSVPAATDLTPLTVHGHGMVRYDLGADGVRIPRRELPRLRGTYTGAEGPLFRLTLTPDPHGSLRASLNSRHEVMVEGWRYRLTVWEGDAPEPRFSIWLPTPRLTTGEILVDEQPVRGDLDLAARQATLVGSFPAPPTGVAAIDQALRGKTILVRVTAVVGQ